MVGLLGSVVAPATLVVGLMFFFGRQHASAFFAYFGVPQSVFDFTTTDYLIRSQDGVFVPLGAVVCVSLAVVWSRRLLVRRASHRFRRIGRFVALGLGIAGLLTAVAATWWPLEFRNVILLPGLSLVAGVLLLQHAAPRPRSVGDAVPLEVIIEWSAVFVLVGVGMFWAVANYSLAAGIEEARQVERTLPARGNVIVHSTAPLNLSPTVATTTKCADGSGYRHEGLKLIIQAGGHYLLLPGDWRPGQRTAVLLPRDANTRLEFSTHPLPPTRTCP